MNEGHRCDHIKDVERAHVSEVEDYPLYGHMILAIHKTEEGWIGHNYEYGDYINFCPFCGEKLL